MATSEEHAREREAFMRFVIASAEPVFQIPLGVCYTGGTWNGNSYGGWCGFNDLIYGGALKPPHILLGHPPPTAFSSIAPYTGWGAKVQVVLKAQMVFGTRRSWIKEPFGEGHVRFVLDYVLKNLVLQKLMEQDGVDLTKGYHDYGPAFAAEANRIAKVLNGRKEPGVKPEVDGLPLKEVVYRRPRTTGKQISLASCWPHSARPEGYYLGHVGDEALVMAGCSVAGRTRRPPHPGQTVWEIILSLIERRDAGDQERLARVNVLERLARRQVERERKLGRLRPERPVLREFERGKQDADGRTISGKPDFDPAWLAWEGGLLGQMVEGIHAEGAYDDLPFLSDALEEAGCSDAHILGHLRAATMGHDATCWVLAGLLEAGRRTLPGT